ncbi:amidohydrolase family protein [Sphingosinicella microcystinivorans]|uniref:amidohydrolase family protein n=1 Tax=Sphingosinicella microcystinivorans TaxID=335406 RepID=UPI0022F3BF79|nr:amidohydrolase family protein [Sphingosinicella microcystinivorans]WBX84162.1 amidohydrolase family protein [Sphingosinicella microcystinivorans]
MKFRSLALFGAAVLTVSHVAAAPDANAQPASAPSAVKALVGGKIVNLNGKGSVTDGVILIEGDKIKAVGTPNSVQIPVGATVIPMNGRWLVPGLMNMHVHLGLNLPGEARLHDEKPEQLALRMLTNARKSLEVGVTTVRLTGDNDGVDFAVKNAIDKGQFPGPRIHTAGRSVAPTGGHGRYKADGVSEISRGVREQIAKGATWIKLGISGGISDERGSIGMSRFTLDELTTAIDIAHRNGVKVTGHTGSPMASMEAINAGIDCFEHGYFFTHEVLQKMKEKGIWYVPTIVVSQKGALEFFAKIGSPQWYLDRQASVGKTHLQTLRDAIKTGINIALGSDQFPFEPNEGTNATVREAEIYQEAGMTPLQALRAATTEPARMLGVEKEVGELKPGMYADIIAVHANPLQSVSALRTISFVMKGGEVVRDGEPEPQAQRLSAPQS